MQELCNSSQTQKNMASYVLSVKNFEILTVQMKLWNEIFSYPQTSVSSVIYNCVPLHPATMVTNHFLFLIINGYS